MLWLRRLVWIAFFVAMLVFGWTFAHRNAEPLHVDYLIGTLAAPGWMVEVAAFLLGGLAASLLFGFNAARLGLAARRYRKIASGLEEELHQLRNLPLAEPDEVAARGGAGRNPATGGLGRNG
jgi:uncharacterized integral membrane protein